MITNAQLVENKDMIYEKLKEAGIYDDLKNLRMLTRTSTITGIKWVYFNRESNTFRVAVNQYYLTGDYITYSVHGYTNICDAALASYLLYQKCLDNKSNTKAVKEWFSKEFFNKSTSIRPYSSKNKPKLNNYVSVENPEIINSFQDSLHQKDTNIEDKSKINLLLKSLELIDQVDIQENLSILIKAKIQTEHQQKLTQDSSMSITNAELLAENTKLKEQISKLEVDLKKIRKFISNMLNPEEKIITEKQIN